MHYYDEAISVRGWLLIFELFVMCDEISEIATSISTRWFTIFWNIGKLKFSPRRSEKKKVEKSVVAGETRRISFGFNLKQILPAAIGAVVQGQGHRSCNASESLFVFFPSATSCN